MQMNTEIGSRVGMNQISLLPESSVQAFNAFKLRNPHFAWINSRYRESFPIAEHAYALPLAANENHLFDFSDRRELFADRYGGEGNGDGGGSGRCGSDSKVQLKGVGKTPLARNETNYFHSYGGLALEEAILEAIWSEACTFALPYGAVRTIGIILSGSEVPVKFKRSDGPAMTPRAIVVREAAIRPAHFMRAVFATDPSQSFPGYNDATRTRAAIANIEAVLLATELIRKDELEAIGLHGGLREIFRRAAHQLAVARAKRIMHGSLTASNMALDGRWMDFGSISAVSDYAKVIIPRGAPNFLGEERLILRTIANLVFYIERFLPGALGDSQSPQYFQSEFSQDLNNALIDSFCSLAGGDSADLQVAHQDTKKRYAKVLHELINAAGQRGQLILSADNDVRPLMPGSFADIHIPSVLHATAFCRTENEFFLAAEPHIESSAICRRFSVSAAALRRETSGNHSKKLLVEALRCMQRNTLADALYRTSLYPEIEDLIAHSGHIEEFIEQRIAIAATYFGEGDRIPVMLKRREIANFHVSANVWSCQGEPVDGAEVLAALTSENVFVIPDYFRCDAFSS